MSPLFVSGKETLMPHSGRPLPSITWGELEVIFEALTVTTEEWETARKLLDLTRRLQPYLSPLDVMREILCIALVLPSENDRPPAPPRRREAVSGNWR
ncbi:MULTISPECIES: hypothetical protein [unclassified Brevundimonas]|uniref:hypothetical protein n=1 Tax=unclassified Brevundimonas TaxID=2622653 RepID=UPI0025BC5EB1|nr:MULTISPECIES: hypothetical protein [unclassified Brevundimonas]